jgi:hypothetical protein
MHNFQCLTVLVELVALGFIFQITMVRIAEMLAWQASVIVSKSVEFNNVTDHLVCWLGIVHNVCISHTVRWCLIWGLLVVYVEFLGLFKYGYKYDVG